GAARLQHRAWQPRPNIAAPDTVGAQLVQAHPAGRRDQPALDVVDLVAAVPQQPRVRLLDRVLGVGQRAQHPVADVEDPALVLLPGACHCRMVLVHDFQVVPARDCVTSARSGHTPRRRHVLTGMTPITSSQARPAWLPEAVWPYPLY